VPEKNLQYAGSAGRLMVVIPDRLSDIISKGEVTARYYNPGDLFRRVDLVTVGEDDVDVADLQVMAGSADLHLHHLTIPGRFFWRTLCFRPLLLQHWARAILPLANDLRPDLIRCHGLHFNAIAAAEIRRRHDVPLVMSLHMYPGQGLGTGWKEGLQSRLMAAAIRQAVGRADLAIAVYASLLAPLRAYGAKRIEVAYNVVNPDYLVPKTDYAIRSGLRLVSVGRLIPGKNPEQIIRAVGSLPEVQLTLIGDGPLREGLKALVDTLGLSERVHFVTTMENAELCRTLADYDAFILHNDYWGIPKTLIEASIVGLPIVHNRLDTDKVPELASAFTLAVDNTAAGFAGAIKQLLQQESLRRKLGEAARSHARRLWQPAVAEARYVELYRGLLEARAEVLRR